MFAPSALVCGSDSSIDCLPSLKCARLADITHSVLPSFAPSNGLCPATFDRGLHPSTSASSWGLHPSTTATSSGSVEPLNSHNLNGEMIDVDSDSYNSPQGSLQLLVWKLDLQGLLRNEWLALMNQLFHSLHRSPSLRATRVLPDGSLTFT